MTNYSLDIQIDQAGLQTIAAAGYSVALLQPQLNADYQIVAVLTSASGTMQVTWTDSGSIYVSLYALSDYSVLQINSSISALSGQTFTYNGTQISATGSTSLAQTIQLTNASTGMVTSGLARAFSINGQVQPLAITSADVLLTNGLGSFEISNQMLLTLMSGAQLGMALPSQVIPNFQVNQRRKRNVAAVTVQPPLLLDFSAGNAAAQTVHFNDQTGSFVPGSLT
ncbi:hypothetical protein [Hoeflea alexandrii]|uniref:hypothetical protein n=1 Tax=Hoeflea alexandrii TaxID=288436 RepID=UPI0022AF2085|nr:hypothetical protein [Hoeflea alexandrii]MCZ4287817.1 hypothetical protein [Hoeflea alexandrii]